MEVEVARDTWKQCKQLKDTNLVWNSPPCIRTISAIMYYLYNESYMFKIFHKLKLDANYIFIIFLVLNGVLLQIKIFITKYSGMLLPNIYTILF
jgi:hypothetical protein